jgi:hypothetical protein
MSLDNPYRPAHTDAIVARGDCDGVACHNTAAVAFKRFQLCKVHAGWITLAAFLLDPDRQHRRGPRSSAQLS